MLSRPFFVCALSSTGSLNATPCNEVFSHNDVGAVAVVENPVHSSLHVSLTTGKVTGGRLAPSTPGRKVTSPVTTWLRPTPYRLKSKSSSLLLTPSDSVVRFVFSFFFVFSLSRSVHCLSLSSPLIRKM